MTPINKFRDDDRYHTVFRLREDRETSLVLTDALEIHYLDMVKWRKLREKNIVGKPLHRWLAYFDRGSPPELIAEVKKMDDAIQTADERMVYVTGDEEAIHAYEMRQMGIYDMNTMRHEGKMEGIEEGREQGQREASLEIARKMKAMGDSIDRIHAITSLSTETIESL